MRNNIILKMLIFMFMVLCAGYVYASDVRISSVNVDGVLRTDKPTVLSAVKTKPGSEFDINLIDQDIINIYKLGFYKSVSASIDEKDGKYQLIFTVKEKPSIRFVTFKGNDEVKDKDLAKVCSAKSYRILTTSMLDKSVFSMMGLYASKGLYLTHIDYKIKPVENNRADVVFEIKESKKTYIKNIRILGNKHIDTSDILDVMKNHRKNAPYIFTFLPWFYSGKLDVNKLSSDMEAIRGLYASKGYINVKVSQPIVTVEPDTGYTYIDISIKEGRQYILKKISFRHIKPVTLKEIKENINTEINKPFDFVQLRKDIDALTDIYADKGYAFADINPIIHLNKKNLTADVTLDVDKGQKIYINRIEIAGNTKTYDNVIRREVRLKERDLYSLKKITRSRQRINNLNFFENVKISTAKVKGKDEVNMKVKVKEKPTGMLSLGVGYSSYDKIGFMGSVAEQNLLGTGIHGKFSGNITSKSALYDLNLVDPWIYNRPISIGVDLFHQKNDSYDYNESSTGGSLTAAKRFWDDDLSVGATYSLSFNNIDITTDTPGYYLEDQNGKHLESSITPFIKYNTLDNNIFPTSGVTASFSSRYTGLGGTEHYMKTIIDAGYFHKLFWDFIGHVKGEVGIADGLGSHNVPVNRRFFLGGIDNLRGFEVDKASPRDSDGNYIGGTREFYTSSELIFPLVKDLKLYGAAFVDIGSNEIAKYDFNNLKRDAGFEIRWISPLGPIRISIAKNLSPKDDEKSTVLQFSMGALF